MATPSTPPPDPNGCFPVLLAALLTIAFFGGFVLLALLDHKPPRAPRWVLETPMNDPTAPPHDWQPEPGRHRSEMSVYRCTRCRLAIAAAVHIVDGAPVAVLHTASDAIHGGPPYVPCGGEDCCGPDDPNDP